METYSTEGDHGEDEYSLISLRGLELFDDFMKSTAAEVNLAMSWQLAAKCWGKGIATRAVKLVTSSIFKEWLHLQRLEALVDFENKASKRALEKAEFERQGVLRKYLIQKGRNKRHGDV
ncbi:hypothetical protein Ancab_013173 [Ancistrocladus abbreviatus]